MRKFTHPAFSRPFHSWSLIGTNTGPWVMFFIIYGLEFFSSLLHIFSPQPGDDIVYMAQMLEKVFLQKLSQMPQKEREIESLTAKRAAKTAKKRTLNAGIWHNSSSQGSFLWFLSDNEMQPPTLDNCLFLLHFLSPVMQLHQSLSPSSPKPLSSWRWKFLRLTCLRSRRLSSPPQTPKHQ